MNDSKNNFSKIIKRRNLILTNIIITLIFILILIIIFIINNNQKRNILINISGKQRILTQMIAKNANRKEYLLRLKRDGDFIADKDTLSDNINEINISLENSKNEFEVTLEMYRIGILKYDDKTYNIKSYIDSVDFNSHMDNAIWNEYSESVDIIAGSNDINTESDKAIYFINMHSEELLENWDEITQEIIKYQDSKANFYLLIVFIIFMVFMVLFFISMYQLNKYLIEPLSALYKGIKNFGLFNENFKTSLSIKDELPHIVEEINFGFSKLDKLIDLIENLNQDISFEGILNYIYVSFYEFIPYSHIGIALLKDNNKVLEASYGRSDESLKELPKKLVGIRANLNETSLENIILNGTPRVINDLSTYKKNDEANYNKILMDAGINSSISLPLKINKNPVGVIFFSSVYKNIYEDRHISFLETLSNSISISLNKNIFIDELLYSTLIALAKMAEARDEDTGDHLERMKQYTVKITEFLMEDRIYEETITVKFLKDIERFSPMHDIGKVGVRDSVLLKPGSLTEEEYAEMKQHAIYGAEVLRTAEGNIAKRNQSMFKMGIEIAEGHHEWWDGSGYPYKKSGADIPLSARIVAIADVFDALTSKRTYKEAFTFDYSFDLIVDGSGTHFDPNIVESIIEHKEELFDLYMSFNKENFFYAALPV
jgi:response regulator RpfG family c-di-GMP phosphodiesterase